MCTPYRRVTCKSGFTVSNSFFPIDSCQLRYCLSSLCVVLKSSRASFPFTTATSSIAVAMPLKSLTKYSFANGLIRFWNLILFQLNRSEERGVGIEVVGWSKKDEEIKANKD